MASGSSFCCLNGLWIWFSFLNCCIIGYIPFCCYANVILLIMRVDFSIMRERERVSHAKADQFSAVAILVGQPVIYNGLALCNYTLIYTLTSMNLRSLVLCIPTVASG